MRVLTWHIHGSYLYYLSHSRHEFLIPVREGHPPRYPGLPEGGFPWPPNLREVRADEVSALELDAILYQHHENWHIDQYDLLSAAQRRLPRIYLEHDPPRENPFEERHPVDDPAVLIVHVTHFNDLMYDCGGSPTRVIEHGVTVPDVSWTGELERGLVVVNHLARRGRRLGADVLERVRAAGVPLDLVGMAAEESGGLGEVTHDELPAFQARYRFLFNPIRYTSLGLAVCEAMAVGMPVVAVATTEHAVAVENGVSGYADTSVDRLAARMRQLLADHDEARRLSEGARAHAREHYGIERFAADWDRVIDEVCAG
jgi:glycosyltransferase involved in cell wall biosynthesis